MLRRVVCLLGLLCLLVEHSSAQRLFISEYVHQTTGNAAAVEIYNPTCATIDLTEFQIVVSRDGGNWDFSSGNYLVLSGTVAAQGTHVVCTTSAPTGVTCSQTFSNFGITGNDAIALLHNWAVIDVLGEERTFSTAPDWTLIAGVTLATSGHVLQRRASVTEGLRVWRQQTNLTTQWDVLASSATTGFGAHTAEATCTTSLLKLTCGTEGDDSIFSSASQASVRISPLQIECPNDCHMFPGRVWGRNTDGYHSQSRVCKALVHSGLYALEGTAPVDDSSQGNVANTQANVLLSEFAQSVTTSAVAADILLLIEDTTSGGTGFVAGTSLGTQIDFLIALTDSLEVSVTGQTVRLALARYNTAVTVLSTLTADKSAIQAQLRSTTSFTSTTVRRFNNAWFTAVRTTILQDSAAPARALTPKYVIVYTTGGSVTNAPSSANIDTLRALGISVIVVGADGGSTLWDDELAAGVTPITSASGLAVSSVITLGAHAATIQSIQSVMYKRQLCAHGSIQMAHRPLAAMTIDTGATYTFTGASSSCVESENVPHTDTTRFSFALLSSVQCLGNCNSRGTCNQRTGLCSCVSPWFGDDCTSKNCVHICHNGGTCDTTTGSCVCASDLFYGDECLFRTCAPYSNCTSIAQGACDKTTGLCSCYHPYFGLNCSEVRCVNDCNGQGVCDYSTGVCTCNSAYTGDHCNVKK